LLHRDATSSRNFPRQFWAVTETASFSLRLVALKAQLYDDIQLYVAAMTAPTGYAFPDSELNRVWRTEFADTVRLALPLALTQLGQIAMMTSDLLLIGRLGDQAVAAASLGHAALFSAFMVGLGFAAAVTPLAAQAFGARNPRMVRRALRVGMWAAVIVGIPITLGLLHTETMLLWFGQTPELSALAGRYLDGMAWCLTPAWLFIALRSFMSAVNRPQPVLWITLAAIPVNALLAYAMIYGRFGLPALDLLGAGLATTFVNIGMFCASLWVCATRRPFRKFHILNRLWRLDGPLLGKLVLLGLPISAAMLLEHGLFAAASLMMGKIGVSALAAHQIALQVTAVVFMVPLGISFAATVRVGHASGRRDAAAARRAGISAMVLGVGFQATMAIGVVATHDQLPLLFLGDAGSQATVAIAATLLLIGAAFFVVDGLQTIAAGSLRGFNDTFVPFLFAAFGFWMVGFVAAWLLAFNIGWGAAGIWIGLSIGIAVYASLLVWRFKVLTDRGHLPLTSTLALR
jgi:MATE family multidrug resistance protein